MIRIASKNGNYIDYVEIASDFISRFLGLMGKDFSNDYPGLLLMNCNSIHTFFMKKKIYAIYLSKDFQILEIETISPWRIGKIVRGTKHILELPDNKASFQKGDFLVLDYLD